MTTQEEKDSSFLAVVQQRKQMTGIECELQEKEAVQELLLKNLKLLLADIKENESEINEMKSRNLKTNEFSLLGKMDKFIKNKENGTVKFFSLQWEMFKIILTNLYNDDSEYIRTLWLTCKRFSFFVASTCKLVSYSKPASNWNPYPCVDEAWDFPEFVSGGPVEICFEWEPIWLNLDKDGFRNETTKKRKAEIDLQEAEELERFSPTRLTLLRSPYVPTSPRYSPHTSP